MELKVTKKRLDTNPIRDRLVQGEALVDRPRIIMHRNYEGLDISGLNFEIRAVSEKETMVRRPLEKTVEYGMVILTWTVTKEFTAIGGKLSLTIVGIDDTGEEIMKITSDKITVRPDPDGDWVAPPPDVVEDAINQMGIIQAAVERAKAEMEGLKDGIPEAIEEAARQTKEEVEDIRDTAKGYVDAASESARQAADSSRSAAERASEAKTSETVASEKATAAAASADAASDSRDKAQRYAELAATIAGGAKGWFPTPEALKEAHPVGQDGWWAIVGTTDTIWVWDSDSGQWKDSAHGLVGGSATADNVIYDNTESGLEAATVQEAIDKLAGGGTAEGTTYDNSESDLDADNVQAAIDELAAKLSSDNLETVESITGKESLLASNEEKSPILVPFNVIIRHLDDIYERPLYAYDGVNIKEKFKGEMDFTDPWIWIGQRLAAHDISGLRTKDHFEFTSTDDEIVKMQIGGINHDLGFGDEEVKKWHIDFISKDCYPEEVKWNLKDYNNGLENETSPYMASNLKAWFNAEQAVVPNATTANPATTTVDYRTNGLLAKLPKSLIEHIGTKRKFISTRYANGNLLTDDTGNKWVDLGKLWALNEMEVYGCCVWGTKGFSQSNSHQYDIFRDGKMYIKGYGNGGNRCNWRLMDQASGRSNYVSYVTDLGVLTNWRAGVNIAVPVCFRIYESEVA